MKIFSLLLFVFFANINIVIAQDEVEELNKYDFQLKIIKANKITVKKVYDYHIHHSGNKVDSTLLWTMNFIYDTNGNVIKQLITDSKKKLLATYECVYNNNGQVTDRIIKTVGVLKSLDSADYRYTYNESGLEVSRSSYYLLKGRTISQKQYDSNGRWIRTVGKTEHSVFGSNSNDFVIQDSLFYDNDGNLNIRQFYTPSGEKEKAYIYSYELQGDNKCITIFLQKKGEQFFLSKTIYNKNDEIIQDSDTPYYNPYLSKYDNLNKIEKFMYNDNGTINTSISYIDGKVNYVLKFIYE